MSNMKESKNEGTCVNCKSDNINYDTFEYNGSYGYFPTICDDCGQEGREYYNIVFDVHIAK